MIISSANELVISFPFSIDQYGKVKTTTNYEKIWADRVYAVIGTLLSERVMRPQFGSNAAKELLSTQDVTVNNVDSSVKEAFVNYLPSLTLNEITSAYDYQTNILTIDISYSLPNHELVYKTYGFVKLSGNNPIYEENI